MGKLNQDRDLISRRSLLSMFVLLPAARLLGAGQDKTFSVNVKVVNVYATVRNKQGQIVKDLAKDDFQLEEDGRPQVISYFAKESDLPLTLGLLVDTSFSQRAVLDQERDASHKFIDQVLREDKDQAFLIHFDSEVELLQDLTSSKQKLQSALGQLQIASQLRRRDSSGGGYPRGGQGGGGGGGTTLYDAVLLASDELMKKQSGRKALVVLSDGVDHGSRETLSDAIASAQRADTLVYSIFFTGEENFNQGGYGGRGMGRRGGGMGWPRPMPTETAPDGKKVLQRVSRETGAAYYEISKKQPLTKTFGEIDEELRSQYSLGYTPDRTDAGAGYRKIHVSTQKGLSVQARDGYYAN